ncbi:LysR family transcriptional regulator ArgP [soil metagenome]
MPVLAGLDPAALRTLAAVARHGTFDAASGALHVTPSAVSQRIKALERQVGRVLVMRSKPAIPTPAGQVLLRLATQVDLLEREALAELTGEPAGDESLPAEAPYAEVPLVVNADTLATWILPALASVQRRHRVTFELLREDEGHSTELLRQGRVVAAVTSDPRPVQGCRVLPLGRMRYLPVATGEYVARWFPDGPRPGDLACAPMVSFDRKDTLQEDMLRRITRQRLAPPTHYIPSSRDFDDAVRLGLGWGMVPQGWIRADLDSGALVPIAEGRHADVALHWQHWRLASPLLNALTEAVQDAARRELIR